MHFLFNVDIVVSHETGVRFCHHRSNVVVVISVVLI